jgi:hypothetical protein
MALDGWRDRPLGKSRPAKGLGANIAAWVKLSVGSGAGLELISREGRSLAFLAWPYQWRYRVAVTSSKRFLRSHSAVWETQRQGSFSSNGSRFPGSYCPEVGFARFVRRRISRRLVHAPVTHQGGCLPFNAGSNGPSFTGCRRSRVRRAERRLPGRRIGR